MARNKGQGRGWHGDSAGHAQAGRQSSGNRKNAGENLSHEDRVRGGEHSHGGNRESNR